MDKQYEILYHNEEERNWWFVARRDMLLQLFREYGIPKDAHIIDIGCAGGAFLIQLKEQGYHNLYALDYSADAIELCRQRGIEKAFVMDGHHPDFPDQTFDVVIASDSLEHLKDDETALANWNRVLKRNGLAFVFVPAYNFLWSVHDEVNYHYRRYTRTGLVKKAVSAGFDILKSGYWNMMIFIPTAIVRLLGRLFKKKEPKNENAQLLHLPGFINDTLIGWLRIENRIASGLSFPFGVSTFIIAKKK